MVLRVASRPRLGGRLVFIPVGTDIRGGPAVVIVESGGGSDHTELFPEVGFNHVEQCYGYRYVI